MVWKDGVNVGCTEKDHPTWSVNNLVYIRLMIPFRSAVCRSTQSIFSPLLWVLSFGGWPAIGTSMCSNVSIELSDFYQGSLRTQTRDLAIGKALLYQTDNYQNHYGFFYVIFYMYPNKNSALMTSLGSLKSQAGVRGSLLHLPTVALWSLHIYYILFQHLA